LDCLCAVLVVWRYSNELKTIIEPDYGLLDDLYSCKALSYDEYNRIRDITAGVHERNYNLLWYITKSDDKTTMLTEALERRDQQHVVNVIRKYQGNYYNTNLITN